MVPDQRAFHSTSHLRGVGNDGGPNNSGGGNTNIGAGPPSINKQSSYLSGGQAQVVASKNLNLAGMKQSH